MEKEEELRKKAEEEQQKPPMLSLASDLNTRWQAALMAKQADAEDRLLKCRRQRNGEYDPDQLTKIQKSGGSTVYMMLTNVKCRAVAAWMRDVMLPPGDKPWSLDPTPVPELPMAQEAEIVQEVIDETTTMMLYNGIDQVKVEQVSDRLQELMAKVQKEKEQRAELAVNRFENKIHDELTEGDFYTALAQVLDDIATYPTGFIAGPEVRKAKRMKWTEDENGSWQPKIVSKFVRHYRRVSPFDIYPGPGARSIQDSYMFERARFNRSTLMDMIGVPGFSEFSIRQVVREFGESGFKLNLSVDQPRAQIESRPHEFNDPDPGIDVLIYWGSASGRTLREWGMSKEDIPDPEKDYQVTAWLIDRWVICARLNPHPLGRRPYHASSYEVVSDSVWGKSPPELMRDIQRICNAIARSIVNNAGLASGPQVEINKDRVDPGEDIESIYPWKIWKTKDDSQGHGKPAIQFYQPSPMVETLLRVYEYFFQQASEQSGIPAYIYGDANVGGAGKTASGLSMLMNAASKTLKSVVSHLDDTIIKPVVRDHWTHIMLYDDDEMKCGDISVVARASEYLIVQEQLQIRRQEFLRETNNEIDFQIMGVKGRAALLREISKSLKMPVDLIPSDDEIEAAMAPQNEPPPEGEVPPGGGPEATGPGPQVAGMGGRRSAIEGFPAVGPGGGVPGEEFRRAA
jgi:hypothetical protein